MICYDIYNKGNTMRKITSLTLGIAFLIMSYTGIILFLVPQGKIAYWADWHLLGLSKTQYGDLHSTTMVIFLIFASIHIYYNWKPLVSYLKDTAKKISFTKKEFVIALLINIVFVTGTLYSIQPFKAFLGLGDSVKDYWAKEYGEPPYGHAEETKLYVLCKKQNIDLERAKEILNQNKIVFEENQNLLTIAKNNSTSPNKIYNMITTNKKKHKSPDGISRLGRKTLQELSDMNKINLEHALEVLDKKGLKNVNSDAKMKQLADELELKPIDVYNEIIK